MSIEAMKLIAELCADKVLNKKEETILRQAIEQAQQVDKEGSPCPEFWDWLPKAYNFDGDGAFTKYNMEVAFLAGKQSVEQAQKQEPVAWATREDFYRELDRSVNRMRQQMEIKGVVMRCADYDVALPIIDIREGHVLVGQVTSSPQRKPLTDEQIEREWQFLHDEEGNPPDHHDFARAIEAAHGITGEKHEY